MKRVNLLIAILLGLSLFSAGCKRPDIVKSMIAFDRAFIPALYYTSEEELEHSQAAMEFLNAEWESVKGMYAEALENDPEWERDYLRIEQMLASANRILSTTENLADAHEALEYVRDILVELRERNGIDYYLDHLNRFHSTMGDFTWILDYRTPETLSEDDASWIAGRVAEAVELWEDFKSEETDPTLFNLTVQKRAVLKKQTEMETDALAALTKALENDDKAAVFDATRSAKQHFREIYLLHGDFERVMKTGG